MHDKYCQVSLLDLLQFTWVALHESMPLVVLLFDINCSCASAKPFPLPLPTISVEDRGAGVAAALPTLESLQKSAIIGQKISLKSGKIFVNNGSLSGSPPNLISPTLLLPTVIGGCESNKAIEKTFA